MDRSLTVFGSEAGLMNGHPELRACVYVCTYMCEHTCICSVRIQFLVRGRRHLGPCVGGPDDRLAFFRDQEGPPGRRGPGP